MRLKTPSAEELRQSISEDEMREVGWQSISTRDAIEGIKGIGAAKVETISQEASNLGRLAGLIQNNLLNGVGERVKARIIEKLRSYGAEFDLIESRPNPNKQKLDFIANFVMPWLLQNGYGKCKMNSRFHLGDMGFEIDLIAQKVSGESAAISVRRYLTRDTALMSTGALLLARELRVADRYVILTRKENSYCTDLGKNSPVDLCFVDEDGA